MAYLRGTTQRPTPPEAPPNYVPWVKTRHILHGWDGSTWDITDGRNGVYLMPVGVEGMGMPEIENYTFKSPIVHGEEWEGWRALPRDVFWTVGIFQDSSEAWLDLKRQFWNIFRPGKLIRWEVILPDNEVYNLLVRFKGDPGSVYSRDPLKLGWAIYGITCSAEQPFWEGRPQTRLWEVGSQDNFFGPSGGPPFYISSSQSIQSATITNQGDVEAFMRWELRGPFSTATVGLNGLTTTVGAALAGDVIVLDTDPGHLTATKNGVDIMSTLGAFEFPPVPPGENIALSLSMTGTGSITASFTPRYLRSL